MLKVVSYEAVQPTRPIHQRQCPKSCMLSSIPPPDADPVSYSQLDSSTKVSVRKLAALDPIELSWKACVPSSA
jgi:hypothetical protein